MKMNDQTQPDITISEEQMQRFGLILIGLAVLFTVIGTLVSPLDETGKPILLLPEVKAVEDYRLSAKEWIYELTLLDGEIAKVIAENQQGDLFSKSRFAQQTLQHAVDLAQQVDRTKVPPVGIGLHEKMLSASMSYLEAARSAMQWISAPDQKNLDQANLYLKNARQLKKELEHNQWLISP
ncbi:MAG: hypothetical protein WCK35_03130 [Chloroflexota bacterium]